MANNIKEERYQRRNGAINQAFGLTYANFLVLPRTFLMDMPLEWQSNFTKLLEQYNESIENLSPDYEYSISISFKNGGKFCKIPSIYTNYRYPKHMDVCDWRCFNFETKDNI